MNPIYRSLMKAKHWQLFTLTFAVPLVAALAITVVTIVKVANTGQAAPVPDLSLPGGIRWIYAISLAASVIISLWYLATGTQARKLVPESAKKRQGVFVFSVIFVLLSSLLSALLPAIFLNMTLPHTAVYANGDAVTKLHIFMIAYMLLQLLKLACQIYIIIYVARAYKSAELGRAATFNDYMLEFFLFMLSFVGFWVLQPTINKMAEKIESENAAETMPEPNA